jgi:CHAT domain-containing protein
MARDEKFTLQVLCASDEAIRVTPFKEGSVLESTVKTSRTCPFHRRLVADRAREIVGLLARANAGVPGLLPELVEASQAIWVDLLPAFLKEKLAEAVGRNLILHLDKPLLGIPWELLHDGDEFLGRRFRIGRLVTVDGHEGRSSPSRRMHAPLSVLIVADPSGDLPAAREEATEVAAILEDAPAVSSVTLLMGSVTTRAFRDALAKHDVLHYAGHAEARPEGGGPPHLRLSDGTVSASLMEQLRGRIDFPGLVFLNACGSADETTRLSAGNNPLQDTAGLASSFLVGGTRHVVGTLWEVRDEVGCRFATSFYRSLVQGGSIGAAMASARDALQEQHGADSLLWAAHLLYGDPTWRITGTSNLISDDFDVLDGLERKYRSELESADPAQRIMAAAMLLRLGDTSVAPTLGAELDLLATWMSGDATARQRRQAGLVVEALASAAGVSLSEDLPDMTDVRALYARLTGTD